MADNIFEEFRPTAARSESASGENPFAEFAPQAKPSAVSEEGVGFTGAVARGFRRSLPETKSLLYGAGAAVADAVGAEGLRDRALNNYRRIQNEEVAPLQGTATFRRSLSGQDSIGEWAGDVIGNFAGQAVQSAAAGAAGAAIGAGGGSVVPGAGTAVGGVTGAVGGLVARGAAKKLVTEAAEKLIANQVAKGVAREAAEAAGKQLVQRRLQQVGGAALASYGLNAAQEAGISYTGRVEDAEAAGEQLGRGDALRALGAGAVAGAVDTAAEGIGVGRLLRGASASPRITRRLLAGTAAGAVTEGATEAAQGAIERWGAQRDLTSAEAMDDYIENAAAGALGGGVMGAGGGVRRRTLPSGAPVPDANNGPLSRAVSNAADTGALDRAAAAQAAAQAQAQPTEASKPQTPATAQRAAEVSGEAQIESPVVQNLRRQQPVPWIDATTGEMRVPSDDEVKAEINRYLDEQAAAGLKRSVKRGELVNALGLDQIGLSALERNTIIGQVVTARKEAETAQATPAAGPDTTAVGATQEEAGDERAAAPVRGSEAARLRRMIDRKGTPYFVPDPNGALDGTEAAASAGVQQLAEDESALPAEDGPGLQVLRGAGRDGVQPVDDQLRELPAGHGTEADAISLDRSDRSERTLSAGELPLGDGTATGSEPPLLSQGGGAESGADSAGTVAGGLGAARDASGPSSPGSTTLGSNQPATPTGAEELADADAGRGDTDVAAVGAAARNIESNTAGALAQGNSAQQGTGEAVAPGGRIAEAASQAATSPLNDRPEPTEAQKKAGNYALGHARIAGLDVSIENPAGTSRRPEWPALVNHYGYFKGTVGRDKDHVDVFLTDNAEDESRPVFVIDQVDPKTGRFDEHKVVMGAATEAEARATYQANYSPDWQGLGGIKQMSLEQFKSWVKDPKKTNRRVTRAARPAPPAAAAPITAPVARPAPAPVEAPLSAAQMRTERQARAEAVFSQNRKAIADKGLRKGDSVAWTQQGRIYTGEILSLGDKEQAVIAVGVRGERGVADYHVSASLVSKVDGQGVKEPSTPPPPTKPAAKSAPAKAAEPVVRVRGGKPVYVPAARGTLEAYFQPGRVVNAYGGKDRVIAFDWKDQENWSVRVVRVDADGNPVAGERERTHRTLPTTRELHAVLGEPRKAEPKTKTTKKSADRGAPAKALFSKSTDTVLQPDPAEAQAFRTALGKMMASKRTLEPPIIVGRTPQVLRALGAPNVPVGISRDTVRKATNGVKHDVPMSIVEQLPELLADPIAVFDSRTEANSMAVVLEATDASGRPVLVAVHLNAAQNRAVVNRVASMYGKDEGPERFAAWTRQGLLRYVAETENPDLVRLMGLQLPASGSPGQGSVTRKVLSRQDIVNDEGANGSGGLMSKSAPDAVDRGRSSSKPLDRRGSPGAQRSVAGLPMARAQQLKEALTANWGENAPNVVLVTDAEGFPNSAKVDRDYQRGEGFYDGRPTVWINLGRIRTEARFAQVLAHEAIGHYGVERIVGESEWAGIVDSIERLDRDGTARGQIRRILAEVHQKQPGLSRENFAREVIAFMAEKGIRNSWVNRVIAAVRRYLRQLMPTMRWRETDVLQLLSAADGFLRRGRDAAARGAMVQRYAFSTDGQPSTADVEEVALDSAFVAGLSPAERRSGPMTDLARALWADLGTDSPFFREWFGDSKVVGKDGTPLKVYHGTAADFDAFDPDRAGKSTNHTTAHLGIFFDANRAKAEHYARVASNDVPADQRVIETYLSIKNPYVMPQSEFVSVEGREESLALRARLEREGYDGIQLPSEGQWIAFHPGQIKSTENRGTFDRTEARMLFSKAVADPASVVDDIEAVMDASRTDAKLVDRARAALKAMSPKGLVDLVARTKDATRPGWLYFLTTRHLTELGADYFPNMRLYSDYLAEMGADRNQLAAEGEEVAEAARKWAGKNRAESQQLFRLMHDATIQGVDPAETYQPLQFRYGGQLRDATKANVKEAMVAIREQMRGRGGDNKIDLLNEAKQLRAMPAREQHRKRAFPSLVERWNQLSPEAQEHYRQMRDLYQKRSGQVEDALVARINDADVPDSHKRKIIATIRQQFESARLQGVYFPLQRFGKHFVAAERDGTPSFLMFESLDQLDRAVKDLRARGFTIKAHGQRSDGKAKDAPSGTFVADVIQALDKAGVSNTTKDQIYQLYLQALPELSMRKHSIHRQSVPGFDPDAIRAFAYNMHHGAHQLAKLRYAHKLQDVIDVLKKGQEAARREPDGNTRRIAAGDAVLSELDRRHEWITNPQDSAATNLISSFGFVYYLGLTPAAALVNLTQTALVSYPYLASRFGAVKAMNALLAAGRQAGSTLGHIQKRLTDPDELRAHQVLQAMGALDKTQAHNLAGIAEGGMQGYNPAWARAMEVIGWGFHKTEVINREATGLAAYRLARAEGKGFDEAVRIAADTIKDTHFDYTNANRARFMQSGTAKVLLMFRQYSLNMSWHLGRMVWNATKGEAPEVRKIARRNLAGILGMSALFSGVLGLPLMGVVMGALNSVASSLGDDDEPWDAETEFRAFLSGMIGATAADTLLGGAVNQVTGADIGSRVSLSQLWFRDADRELEGRGAYYNLLEQAAGPMGGVLKNALVGKQLIDDGHLMRGVETVLPKSLKDVLKAGRYATQGANNLRGDAMVEDLNPLQVLLQLNGFTPNELAERYDRNRSLKNYEQHILDRRQHLVGAFAMANRLGDDAGKRDVVEAIARFNVANPEVAITPASIRRSLLQRARYSAEAEGGIMLNRKLAPRLREAVGE